MSIILIVSGIALGGWAAKALSVPEAQRPIVFQGPVGGMIQIVCQLGGLALVIYGLVHLFS